MGETKYDLSSSLLKSCTFFTKYNKQKGKDKFSALSFRLLGHYLCGMLRAFIVTLIVFSLLGNFLLLHAMRRNFLRDYVAIVCAGWAIFPILIIVKRGQRAK